MPSVGSGHNTGFHFSIPYYWVLGPDADLTLAPRFNSTAGPLLAGQYRQRWGDGTLNAVASINRSNVGEDGIENTGDKMRGHIEAAGVWDLNSPIAPVSTSTGCPTRPICCGSISATR